MTKDILHRENWLKPLSRDHGVLLVLAQKLRYSAKAPGSKRMPLTEKIMQELAEPVVSYLSEEEMALGRIEMKSCISEKMAGDHAQIIEAIESMRSYLGDRSFLGDQRSLRMRLNSLAALIESHVYWDEHVLFPYIQDTVKGDELQALQDCTARFELTRSRPTQQLHQSVNRTRP